MSRHSSLNTVTGHELDERRSIPGRGRDIHLCHHVQLCSHSASLFTYLLTYLLHGTEYSL